LPASKVIYCSLSLEYISTPFPHGTDN